MTIEDLDNASIVNHKLAKDILTEIRDVDTHQVDFRRGLVKLGRICGYEIIDSRLETEPKEIETPLEEMSGECVKGLDNVIIINVLRAATPFVEGLLKAFPEARQGVISASRNEHAGRTEDGTFPITVDYVKLPEITADDTVIVADPMLATGSTMTHVLEHVLEGNEKPKRLIVLATVSAPEGIERIKERVPDVDIITVAIDSHLDENGFIVPGLGDAGDRAFRTT